MPTLRALVPDHVALTSRSQPTLLWHLDVLPPDAATLMFVLTDEEAIDPLVSVKLERPTEAGLQRIELSNYPVQLEPNRQYQWSVALVTDFQRRSRDIVTIGWIERVGAYSGEVVPSSGRAAEADVAALAAAGLWYDAVEAANEAEQAALLDQVGLSLADGP